MMLSGITNALRGISGEFEVTRVVGAFGVTAYVVCANVFVGWNMAKGQNFDVIAYCAAFPTGLGVAIAAIAGAASVKDRNVAVAQTVSKTGSMPGKAANAPTEEPTQVTVTNTGANPVPVDTKP